MRILPLLLFLPVMVFAEPVNLDLQRVRLPDFVQLVYGQILQKSYVMDTEVLASLDEITINLQRGDSAILEREARAVLDMRGFQVGSGGSVLHIRKKDVRQVGRGGEVFMYRPRFRPVSYLQDAISTFFEPGAFAGQHRASSLHLAQVSGQPTDSGPPQQTKPATDLGSNTFLDRDADVLIFQGQQKDIARLQGFLAQLDRPVGEILVKAVVYEVKSHSSDASAVDLAASILSGRLGLKLSGIQSGAAQAFAKASFFGLDFSAAFSALASDSRFKLVTSPHMRVRSGSSARFVVGDETPILGAVSQDNSGRAVQSVEYKPSGVIFDLKPVVRSESIDLNIQQQISQFVATTNGVNNSPTLTKRQLSTDITARDQDLILIGGLDETRRALSGSGLSFLPDWLRSTSAADDRTEILVMLHVQKL